jgi:hypothetical protein
MRVRCPACSAPYFLPDVSPPDGARCPNCDAPAPAPNEQPRRAEPVEPPGRSRVVTAVGLLHWVVAASGLCVVTGMSAVIGERGTDPISAARVLFAAGWAVVWAVVGVGILRRSFVAWRVSVVLLGIALLFAFASVVDNRVGAVAACLLYGTILSVLIARRGEFR